MIAKHRKIRFDFAKKYESWTSNDWVNVIFTDESKINLFNPDGNHLIRRTVRQRYSTKNLRPTTIAPKIFVRQRYSTKNLRPTVKFGGGAIMLWGAFTRSSPGPLVLFNLNFDVQRYKAILENDLLPFATTKIGQR